MKKYAFTSNLFAEHNAKSIFRPHSVRYTVNGLIKEVDFVSDYEDGRDYSQFPDKVLVGEVNYPYDYVGRGKDYY